MLRVELEQECGFVSWLWVAWRHSSFTDGVSIVSGDFDVVFLRIDRHIVLIGHSNL